MNHPTTTPSAWQGGLASISCQSGKCFLIGLACTLSAFTAGESSNLVRNGNFSAGTAYWVKAPEFGTVEVVVDGQARINQPLGGSSASYYGPVLSQGINVTGIANQTINVSVSLAKNIYNLPPGNSFSLSVEYLLNNGTRHTATVIQPDNRTAWPPGSPAGGLPVPFSGSLTFPPEANKLVKVSLHLNNVGAFLADDVVITGPITEGPVPVISSLSPATAPYLTPITITGSGFGSTPGVLAVGDTPAQVAINSWSDTQVVFQLASPHHGGMVRLETGGVMASQSFIATVSSPHFRVSTPKSTLMAMPGQVVDLPVWVHFHNGYSSVDGIDLAISGTNAATFSPPEIRHQGGSRLSLGTTGLSSGVHSFEITSSDGSVTGNPVPLTLDIRQPASLALTVLNPDSFVPEPVHGTLMIASHAARETTYVLRDGQSRDMTAAGLLNWASSDPDVLRIKSGATVGTGPTLYPQADGTCTLTATTASGFSSTTQVQVSAGSPAITSIGFTSPVMNNSGTNTNRFQAVTNGFSAIGLMIHPRGFNVQGEAHGTTATMDFRVQEGLAPGWYEFTAENDDFFSPARRSALVSVVNAPGTGILEGAAYLSTGALTLSGNLEFYHDGSGLLALRRGISEIGKFQLGAIPPGSYRLKFIPTQSGGALLATVWYPNSPSFDSATAVLINNDSTTGGADFFVTPMSVSPPELVIPEILTAHKIGNVFTLSFKTKPGLVYHSERSSTPAGPWTAFDTRTGDGGLAIVNDVGAFNDRGFYRVRAAVE